MKIGIISTKIYDEAIKVKNKLIAEYNFVEINGEKNIKDIDIIVVLGGDGFMLRTIHNYYKYNIPFFGINYGNIGFLLNNKECIKDLINNIKNGQTININPLKNEITDINGQNFEDIAINELTLIRNVYKTCDINISINEKQLVKNYSGDGLIVSTPIGSTAYNSSVGGPIISYKSNSIILSTISPFRPRTLRSVILQNDSICNFHVNYSDVRLVSVFSDFVEYKDIIDVKTYIDFKTNIKIIFNNEQTLDNKILIEQFK